MRPIVYNGQELPVGGMYVDDHGHVMFLRAGDLAPICPRLGPSIVRWILIREIATAPETEPV